jgi:hypothetical protein
MARGIFTLKQQLQGLQQRAWSGTMKTPAVDYLVVAGGGGGASGGGGAGGLLQGSIPVIAGSAITVTVGSGGSGGTGSTTGTAANNGNDSVFGNIAATAGGKGSRTGNTGDTSGGSGGSGGGFGAFSDKILFGGQGVVGQGNDGGSNGTMAANYPAGGGGGAGTIGLNGASATLSGNGGAGIASAISGTVTAYAGGGGGGYYGSGGTAGTGGTGGGGNGGAYGGSAATSGISNTGGGGGGAASGGTGGAGGSGIVIVSYPDVYAAATGTTGSPTVSTSGSGSLLFNGSTDYLSPPSNAAVAFGTGDFTLECWIYATAASDQGIYEGRASGNGTTGFTLTAFTSSVIRVYTGSSALISSAGTSYLNQWTHVAVVRLSGTTTLYINGQSVGTSASMGNLTDTTPVIGGGRYTGTTTITSFFAGYISNFRMVKGTAVYTGAFTPSTTPLTAITNTSLLLNTVSGAQFADSSTNSFTMTRNGTPAWNQASPFATGLGYKNRVYTWTSSGSITF